MTEPQTCSENGKLSVYTYIYVYIIIGWVRRQYGWILHEYVTVFSRAAGE